MEYLKNTNQKKRFSKLNTLKERCRNSILKLGYDYINYKRGVRKDLSRFTYNLKSITINN